MCICVQVFVYLRRGNSSVRVAYVHNIPMISHCGSQLAPWLLFNGACLYMKSRQCQSNETYQMFFHFPRLFFFHSKKFEKGPDPPMVQKKIVIQLFVRLLREVLTRVLCQLLQCFLFHLVDHCGQSVRTQESLR